MKRAMNILSKVMYGVSFFFLIAVASFFLLPHVPGVGALDVKIVKSGSMEPNVMTGGIVFIREIPSYNVGDIVTFQSVGADIPTTHRIIGTEESGGRSFFVTKGDANEERDTDLVSPSMIHGKMLLTVPNIGFVFDFARQPMGFMFLIALPALLIVFDELEKIWKEYRRIRIKRRAEMKPAPLVIAPFVQEPVEPRMIDINSPVAILETRVATNVKSIPIVRREMSPAHGARERGWILASCIVLAFSSLVVGLGSFGQTVSYFSDIERALANEFRAVALGFTATPDDDLFSFVDGVLDDADGAVITNVIPESGSTNLKYSLTTEFIDGNQALCKSIVGTSVNPPFAYIGPLTGLVATNVLFPDPWSLGITLNASTTYGAGDTCVLDFIYTGWNGDLSEGDGGYVDTEKVRLTFGIPVPLFAPKIEFSPLSAGAFIGEEAPPPPPSQEGTSTEETTGTTTEEIPPEPIPVVETGGNEGGGAPAGEEIPPPPAVIEEPTGELPPEEVVDPIPPDVVEEPEVIVEPVIETGGTEGGGTPVGEPAL